MSHFCFHEPKKTLIQKARRGPRRPVTSTYKRLSALSNQMSRPVQVSLVHGIRTFKKKISDSALFEAWKTGSYGHLMKTIPWDLFPEDLEPIRQHLKSTVDKSAMFSKTALPAPVQEGLRFDTKNQSIDRYLNSRTGHLIHDISTDTQSVIQTAVRRSFDDALRPNQVASMIKGNIGLLPRHAIAVENYRDGLTNQGVNPDRVEKLVEKYQDKLLTYRANMIARTETRFATNQGQLEIWKTAANQDLIDRHTAKKVWIVDGAPCEICEPMDGIAVPLDGLWTLNTGDVVSIPTESHPHCMCGMELHFGNAEERLTDGAPEEEDSQDE